MGATALLYVEVAGVIRHRTVVTRTLSAAAALTALDRLERWHLLQALVPPLLAPAWQFRHKMTTADAVYVALAKELGATFLSDDQKLMNSPTFPRKVTVLRLPVS